MRKKLAISILIMIVVCGFAGCGHNGEYKNTQDPVKSNEYGSETNTDVHVNDNDNITGNDDKDVHGENSINSSETGEGGLADEEEICFINGDGATLEERINVPEDYERVGVAEDSLTAFLRSYEMKEDNAPVLLYNGTEKGNQNVHVAVFKLPIEEEDLQQCADSVMRVFGEYYYSRGEYDKINFTLGGNFKAEFKKWSQGYGISLNGNDLYWKAQSGNDSSYDSFKKFMRIVFAYSGTMNLESDSKEITIEDINVGDMFIKGGSPGHVVMVVDLCQNEEGKKAFLLAQGYMPAQEFHVLKNPLHEEDPWYYQDEITYPLRTAEYTFDEGSLKRPNICP